MTDYPGGTAAAAPPQAPAEYHDNVHRLVRLLRDHIRAHGLLMPGDRAGVAVSGGADSVALLCLLLELRVELGLVLSVIHFHHQIRGAEADADQQFVADLAREHNLEAHFASGNVPAAAAEEGVSLEAAARALRYGCFGKLVAEGRLDKVITAHTLDDQAETVLLKLLRGAGTRGLAGIYPRVQVESEGTSLDGAIVRPLLGIRRALLRDYLQSSGQTWREDASNLDLQHRRNQLRHTLLPHIERDFNPAAVERLGELAEIARAEEEYWTDQVRGIIVHQRPISVSFLRKLPLALQRRVVRAAAETHGLRLPFAQVQDILTVAEGPEREKKLVLPRGWQLLRQGDALHFKPAVSPAPSDYEYALPAPGRAVADEIGVAVDVELVARNGGHGGALLSTRVLSSCLTLRNWRPGDRFWPAHTKAPKKVKELLQERRIPQEQRRTWPVIASAKEIVWVRGFPIPEHLQPSGPETQALLIQETPLQDPAARRQ